MRSTASSGNHARDLALLLPLVAFLFYAATAPGLARGDAAGVYVTAAALIERGTGAIDGWTGPLAPPAGAAPGQGDSATNSSHGPLAYAGGHYFHATPPGPAVMAAPIYALGTLVSPFAGPLAPVLLVALFGPLAGAVGVAGVVRLLRRANNGSRIGPFTAAAAIAALWPLSGAWTAPLAASVLGIWLWPLLLGAVRSRERSLQAALVLGLGLGAFASLDYGAGALALLALVTVAWSRRRDTRAVVLLLLAAALPLGLLALYQAVSFGRPWGLAFRLAVDPAARSWTRLVTPAALVALLGPVLWYALGPGRDGWARWSRALAPIVVASLGTLIVALRGYTATVSPLNWREPALWVAVLVVAALLALAAWSWTRRVLPGALAMLLTVMIATWLGSSPAVARATVPVAPEQYLAPFAIQATDGPRLLWVPSSGSRADPGGDLRLPAGGNATSPWVDVTPGVSYTLTGSVSAPVSAIFRWEDVSRRPLVQHAGLWRAGEQSASFAAPPGAAGLRIEFAAQDQRVRIGHVSLAVAHGVRIEPFPDYARAALAFSYDWESAMGGLIHTRSAPSAGEGPGGTLTAGGVPSVAEAEERGLLMRDGARYLATIFKRDGIHATFYATGYDLLDGNPSCERFLGDPYYKDADLAHGWGSDYWRTHPWYSFDPCTTERDAPAWYFASETRELAADGHEIGSHTFGHLYVRGVTPDELAADLKLWIDAARRLGLPAASTFAFPWTSSNSLDARFWSVFERVGLTVLTRMYQPLAHPFELDRVPGFPKLSIFPDQYLPSTPVAERRAFGGIDETLARRGYFSLWAHPDEVMRQDGPRVWSETIAYAAAKRADGLWIAPVGHIAGYGIATRDVQTTALPVGGGTLITVRNGSTTRLDGVTLSLSAPVKGAQFDGRATADMRGSRLRLPSLAPGATVTVLVAR